MDIDFSEAAEIDVEVQALNLEGIKQNLLDYIQDQAKIDIADSVDKADKSAKSAEAYAGEAATSATTASECAEQTSVNLGLYYKKSETDVLLNAKAAKAATLAGYGITDAYTKTQVDSSLSGKASTSLDNLSAAGQMIIDSQNGTISNCILEIPQNLKLEYNNGVVTLKAGSIITRTGSTYSTLTTTQDITWGSSSQANKKMYLFASNSGNPVGLYNNVTLEKVGSGVTLPANSDTYSNFYLTTDKIIYSWSNGSWQASNLAYPLGIIETDENGNITGFAKDSNGNDMIFNGMGFVGQHRFVYPNVKCLFAAGKDSNGKLLSNIVITNGLLISGNTTQERTVFYLFSAISANAINPNAYYYSEAENLWRRNDNNNVLNTCVLANTSGNVDSMAIRQPYQGARNLLTDDLYKQIGDVETLLATV